jgi:NAD(P)-dependent dehydrogenase (short-subunit alcohol dehydrogenase family)
MSTAVQIPYRSALIVGAGPGLGASLARVFMRDGGMRVVMASRQLDKLQPVAGALGAVALRCDATDPADVKALFEQASDALGAPPDVVVYNASRRVRGAFIDVDANEVAQAVTITAHGAFLVAQEGARRMLPQGQGALLFTGASASTKGYPLSAAFAMGKFALRGLAQSLARELHPQGVHVGHFVIDGSIGPSHDAPAATPATAHAQLDPDAIAQTYLHLLAQPRNAWTWEIEVRPWVEKF